MAVASIRGFQNATLRRLADELIAVAPQLSNDFDKKFAEYKERCKYIGYRRDKELAHADFGALLARHEHHQGPAMFGPSRNEIELALKSLRDFMRFVESSFGEAEMAYEAFISRGGADSMLSVLKQGIRYGQLQAEKVIPNDDTRSSDLFGV